MFQINTLNYEPFYNRQIKNEIILFYRWNEGENTVLREKIPY